MAGRMLAPVMVGINVLRSVISEGGCERNL